MAKVKRRLNDRTSKVIEKVFLEETPDELPDNFGQTIVEARVIPTFRKITFLNGRDPGVALQFHYHSKTHPLKQYTLYHGFEHELPEEVIEHLENCKENQYAYRRTAHGEVEHYVKGHKYLFQCRAPKRAA